MGNAASQTRSKRDPCSLLVNWSIAGLILANLLFLGQKIPVPSWIAKPVIQSQLRATERALELWRSKHGHYPGSLGAMMAAPEIRAKNPPFHDIAGNRLQYIRIGLDAFILRSFGSDSLPALSAGPQDDVILESIASRDSGGMTLVADGHRVGSDASANLVEFALYPPAASDGLWSPDGKWVARIASNPDNGEHRIIVMKEDHSRVLISPHDRVEEFLWETGSEPSLIFSATGSDLYDDGIFRWRLSAGEHADVPGDVPTTENLLSQGSNESLPGGIVDGQSQPQKSRWVIALLQDNGDTVSQNGLTVIAAPEAKLIAKGGSTRFLDPANLWQCPRNRGPCSRLPGLPGKKISFKLTLDQTHKIRGRITPAQERWNQLPVRGRSQDLLESWFAAASSDELSPLQPYVLFYAIVLQDQARASAFGKSNHAIHRKLAEWTAGMTQKLVQSQETPRYLQALILGADRPSLKNKGPGSNPLFELTDTDLMETDKNAEKKQKKKPNESKTSK